MEFILNILLESWELLNEMSPYLLLGFLLAGLMHVYVPHTLYNRHLGSNNMHSVLLAALIGIPLPLCSCGVIPTAMGLKRHGASKGATVSFLTATPQTGIDSIIATYSLMGLPFALIRPIAALITALFGGWMTNLCDNTTSETYAPVEKQEESKGKTSTLKSIREVFQYAFVEMMEDIGKWLVVGLLIAGIITAAIPDSWFGIFQGSSFYSILFVLLFSIPMYLCATGSIPIAVALMLKGLTPGAAFVLLMAGPASNAASILVIRQILGRRTMLTYLCSIILSAICFGLLIDVCLPQEWFTGMATSYSCHETSTGWFSLSCTLLMVILMLHALWHHHRHPHHHETHEEKGCKNCEL